MFKRVLFFFTFSLLLLGTAQAQKFLAIDKYGTKRERLMEGEGVYFKLKGDKTLFYDHIKFLGDTSLVMEKSNTPIPISQFEEFRFKRGWVQVLRTGTLFMGGGFLLAAAIEPAVSNSRYDAKEAVIIGASFVVVNQGLRFLKWRKYKVGTERARVQILDTTIKKE
ncbi:hypothetical protein V6R21_14955 [Limibacter armeniacum]|uniref:hypothetical protein n=1 Tax=Limibacter armeniacum TaxID=466084 RepID=UPI002FE52457